MEYVNAKQKTLKILPLITVPWIFLVLFSPLSNFKGTHIGVFPYLGNTHVSFESLIINLVFLAVVLFIVRFMNIEVKSGIKPLSLLIEIRKQLV